MVSPSSLCVLSLSLSLTVLDLGLFCTQEKESQWKPGLIRALYDPSVLTMVSVAYTRVDRDRESWIRSRIERNTMQIERNKGKSISNRQNQRKSKP